MVYREFDENIRNLKNIKNKKLWIWTPYNKNIERVLNLRVHISQANKLQWVKFYNRREESLALVRLAVFLRSYSLGLIASPTT